jgi:hypothetical protein
MEIGVRGACAGTAESAGVCADSGANAHSEMLAATTNEARTVRNMSELVDGDVAVQMRLGISHSANQNAAVCGTVSEDELGWFTRVSIRFGQFPNVNAWLGDEFTYDRIR